MRRKFYVTVETESESAMGEVIEELKNTIAELDNADDANVVLRDARFNGENQDDNKIYHGKVKVWFDDKKYGFIIPDNNKKDLFVHLSGLTDGLETLQPDQEVEYSVTKGKKGLQAVLVRTV